MKDAREFQLPSPATVRVITVLIYGSLTGFEALYIAACLTVSSSLHTCHRYNVIPYDRGKLYASQKCHELGTLQRHRIFGNTDLSSLILDFCIPGCHRSSTPCRFIMSFSTRDSYLAWTGWTSPTYWPSLTPSDEIMSKCRYVIDVRNNGLCLTVAQSWEEQKACP